MSTEILLPGEGESSSVAVFLFAFFVMILMAIATVAVFIVRVPARREDVSIDVNNLPTTMAKIKEPVI